MSSLTFSWKDFAEMLADILQDMYDSHPLNPSQQPPDDESDDRVVPVLIPA